MGELTNLVDIPTIVRSEVAAGDHQNLVDAINVLIENQRRIAIAAGVIAVPDAPDDIPPPEPPSETDLE